MWLLRLPFIAAHTWILLLLLCRLLLLATKRIHDAAEPAFLLIAGASTLVLIPISKQCSYDAIRELARIFASGQQVLQFHLRYLLCVWRDLRFLECAGDDDRHYEFALVVCQRGIHKSANLVAAWPFPVAQSSAR